MKALVKPKLPASTRKALDAEIDKQIAENLKKLEYCLQTLVLWELHSQLGFGKKRLLRFHKKFKASIKEMEKWYEMDTADRSEFLFRKRLKDETGIDVRELEDGMFEFEIHDTKKERRI